MYPFSNVVFKKKHATEEASWISVYRGQSLFPDLLFDTSFTKILPWGKEEFFLEYNWIRFHWGFCLGKVLGNTIFGISQKVSFFCWHFSMSIIIYILVNFVPMNMNSQHAMNALSERIILHFISLRKWRQRVTHLEKVWKLYNTLTPVLGIKLGRWDVLKNTKSQVCGNYCLSVLASLKLPTTTEWSLALRKYHYVR